MDEAKDQINDIEHKEEKTFNKNKKKKKKIQKKQGETKEPLGKLKMYQHSNHRGDRRRRERARN